MVPRRSQGRASFFWQGLFILLPVAIMAGIALAALVRDRAAAEREARQRAEELLQQVANGFERGMGSQLSMLTQGTYGWYDILWSQQHLSEAALWPGGFEQRKAEQERQKMADAYREAEAAFEELERVSGLPPENLIISGIAFTPQGTIGLPEQAREAQPPPWRLQLSAEQLAALKALEELNPTSTNAEPINLALKRFLDTGPPEASWANAQFIRLRLLLAEQPAASAVPQWLDFARAYARELQGGNLAIRHLRQEPAVSQAELSESGIPVTSLAVAKALEQARQLGPTDALWSALVREVEWVPSSFTPMLLELAEPLTQGRPELQPCLQALRLRWQATERAWEVAELIRCSGRLQGVTTTNFWLDFQGIRWLCLLQPGGRGAGTGPTAATNWFTQVQLCPKVAVEQALRRVVQKSKVSLPPYLRLAAEVEGESLLPIGSVLPGPATPAQKPAAAMTLAQTEGRLTSPTIESASQPVEFESMPGRPHYTLRIELADRALLFAAQRRRTWLYGALVLAAALTAAVGFGAAYRSFHRQLRLNEMKSNFVSSVSHELRAPIASVRLMAESLERGKIVEAPKQQEYFRFIGQECRRLSALIENVLDFSRIEQGRKQYEFEPTDLVELTRHTVQLMDTYAAERGVKLVLALPDPLPRRSQTEAGLPRRSQTEAGQPSVDGKAIQQALINLIDNALKHSPKGETVTVGLELRTANCGVRNAQAATQARVPERGGDGPSPGSMGRSMGTCRPHPFRAHTQAGTIALWVEDHGPGIPASEHERIFERFYRLGSELRRDTQGVGIGLSIVKHVVEAHGGRVRVQSSVGQGSRFTIELPVDIWNAS